MKLKKIDIKENIIDLDVLLILLKDRTTGDNIIWATDEYSSLGKAYSFASSIDVFLITGENEAVIKPRVEKDLDSQDQRSRDKAEVFTPSWVCNIQNNLVDDAWFGKHTNRFNKELNQTWESTYTRKSKNDIRDRIKFPKGKTWKDYVCSNRIEVSCGEAPYLTSRYDTVTGKYIKPKNRIGLLDRKLRVVTENTPNNNKWLEWASNALKSIYGFDWQGDNVLLARENVFFAVCEYYEEIYDMPVPKKYLLDFAEIISWNIWQMDGVKYVIPNSCHEEEDSQLTFFESDRQKNPCPGCYSGDKMKHNGIYATIMDWEENKVIRFVDLFMGGMQDGTF